MTYDEMCETLDQLRFRDWTFRLSIEDNVYLRVEFDAPCTATGHAARQMGRKWRLSSHMTRSEFVMTALKAVLTAVEHEAREDFLYRDARVFGPHIDVDELVEIAERVDVREPVPVEGGVQRQGVVYEQERYF